MNVLITAGGTSEKIDEVRKIGNMATGRLGSLIADYFIDNYDDVSITYVCSRNSVVPKNRKVKTIFIEDVYSLKLVLEKLLKEQTFDAIIHSMAVSDYTVKYCASSDSLAEFVTKNLLNSNYGAVSAGELTKLIKSAVSNCKNKYNSKKISSEIENLIVCLERTPKIIEIFKKLQPDTVLVGFKLLVDVDEDSLINAAKNLMIKNKCDFVLANDAKNVNENQHIGFLIGADNSAMRLNTKDEIARAIAESVIKRWEKKQK